MHIDFVIPPFVAGFAAAIATLAMAYVLFCLARLIIFIRCFP